MVWTDRTAIFSVLGATVYWFWARAFLPGYLVSPALLAFVL
ncbi:hypothetical protein [Reticulibacter mediterranei]|nr:hypothetical protein [Reticulibacter mediterranei]